MTSPFLARRIWGSAPFRIGLARCKGCGFAFFNPRMESDEEHKLYGGYRDEKYLTTRESCEPWYTAAFNEKLNDPTLFEARKRRIRELLGEHLNGRRVSSVLDFGGDRGELIHGLIPGATEFVYDISQVVPMDGIERCSDLEDCRRRRCDLIVCSNVLEHVSFPREVLADIGAIAHPETLLFLEVPCESPSDVANAAKRLVQEGVLMLQRPRIGTSLLGPGLLHQMHEHINFFSPETFHRLVTGVGFRVLAEGVYDSGYSWGFYKLLGGRTAWCLAQAAI